MKKPPPRRPQNRYRIIFPNGDDKYFTTSEVLALPQCKCEGYSTVFQRFKSLLNKTTSDEELAKLRYYAMKLKKGKILRWRKVLAMIRGVDYKKDNGMRRKDEIYGEMDGVIVNTTIPWPVSMLNRHVGINGSTV